MHYGVVDEALFNKKNKNIVLTDYKYCNVKQKSFNIHTTTKLAEDAVIISVLGLLKKMTTFDYTHFEVCICVLHILGIFGSEKIER